MLACWLVSSALLFGQGLSVVSKSTLAPEMGELKYLELRFGSEAFTILPPVGTRIEVDGPAARLTFSGGTNAVSLAIRFATNEAKVVLASLESMRQFAVPYLGEAEVTEEFPAFSGDMAGKGFAISYSLRGQRTRCQVAVLPLRQGCISFVASAPAPQTREVHQLLGGALTSFQRLQMQASSR